MERVLIVMSWFNKHADHFYDRMDQRMQRTAQPRMMTNDDDDDDEEEELIQVSQAVLKKKFK